MRKEWKPRSSAPRDGTVILGRNRSTGNCYETWFDDTRVVDPDARFLAELLAGRNKKEVGKWWCARRNGTTCFIFHEWKPRTQADSEHLNKPA